MGLHEDEFGSEGGVCAVDGTAAGVEGFGGVIVGVENDEAGREGCVGGLVDVWDGRA